MSIADALREHEERVDGLIKSAAKYVSTLKSWKKACQTGHMGNRQRAATAAVDLARDLAQPATDVAAEWSFDARAYLEGDDWRRELQAACAECGLRILEEEETLISPPVVVRAQPGQPRYMLGRVPWPALHPKVTAAYLKRLNEKSSSSSVLQRFLNALYDGSKKVARQDGLATFRDLYDLFSYAPDWKRDNPRASFGQQIYALHRSDVRTTRDGRTFELEFPAGKVRDADVFSVISEDGRAIRYYGIWFR